MSDINLIPKNINENKSKKSKFVAIVFVAFFVMLIVFGFASNIFIDSKINAYKEDMHTLDKEYKEFRVVDTVKRDINMTEKTIKNITQIIEQQEGASFISSELLDKIAKDMPDSVFAINIGISNVNELVLNGKSKDAESVAYFGYKLSQDDFISEVKINSVSADGEENDSEKPSNYSFSMNIKLKR